VPLEHQLLSIIVGDLILQITIRVFYFKGEIITTPFSFVATTRSIVWEGCAPICIEIDLKSLDIALNKIKNGYPNMRMSFW
jgi:dTDP-4-amino-4,6-dideoxygalactose transaminase